MSLAPGLPTNKEENLRARRFVAHVALGCRCALREVKLR